jgi:hypothetical protein
MLTAPCKTTSRTRGEGRFIRFGLSEYVFKFARGRMGAPRSLRTTPQRGSYPAPAGPS